MNTASGVSEMSPGLESVLSTAELSRRAPRRADLAAENRALVSLAEDMVRAPGRILEKLAETAMELCQAQSAGISLLDASRESFFWPAIVGLWSGHVGGGTPRNFGPCGTVLDRNAALLFSHPERHFTYLAAATPAIDEALLLPFFVDGQAVGTIWVIAHDKSRQFDTEDLRVLTSLATFAGAAYKMQLSLNAASVASEEAHSANRAKSEFLAAMSHELRTPLNAIGGYAELLEMGVHGTLNADQQRDLARIKRSQLHLLGLINDVLDLAKIDAGQMEYLLSDVRVDAILRDSETMIAPQLHAKRHAYRYDGTDPALTVRADAERLQQVLLNLLSNAIKFTPEGGEITVECVLRDDDVQIRVRDNGLGISPAKLDAVFEPFVQVERRLSKPTEGVGLGLAISRDLARGMGGDLGVESTPGSGSTFTLTLKRDLAPKG